MSYKSRKLLLLCGGTAIAAITLAGCGGSSTKAAGPGSASASQSAAVSSPSAGSPSPTSPASATTSASPAVKTCSGGRTAAIINGKSKCLTAGQMCSAKAIDQYPQYGYVCTNSNGKLVLRRK